MQAAAVPSISIFCVIISTICVNSDVVRRERRLLSISVFSVVYFSKDVANWCAAQQI
jgi:hypothetical protein